MAIAAALAEDAAVSALVPDEQVYAVERATFCRRSPPSKSIGLSSEVDAWPLVRHELSIECTVSHAVRGRGRRAARCHRAGRTRPPVRRGARRDPIDLPTRAGLTVALKGTRWSTSASGASGVVRGASVAVSVLVAVTVTDIWDPRRGGKTPRTGGGGRCRARMSRFLFVTH